MRDGQILYNGYNVVLALLVETRQRGSGFDSNFRHTNWAPKWKVPYLYTYVDIR